jgi:alkaline phosphatase D
LPSGSHFRFVATSCSTPNFPYKPFSGRRIKGFDLLADYLWPTRADSDAFNASPSDAIAEENQAPPTEFMVFLGDFIYADVPFYFGDNAEHYRRLYRRNYQSESFRKVYERLRELSVVYYDRLND